MTMLLDAGGRGAVAGQARRRRDAACREGAPPMPARGPAGESRQTLDDLLSHSWEGLLAASPAACPVCHGEMAPRWSAGAGVVGGRCGDCGSELG
jgi:hypothetical protein